MKIFFMSFCLVILSFCYGFASHRHQIFPYDIFVHLRNSVAETYGGDGYKLRVEFLSRYPVKSRVVMLGDSLTEQGFWSGMFPCDSISNQGISGDTTSGVIARLSTVTKAQPEIVALMIGTNDVAYRHDLDLVKDNITRIVDFFQRNNIKVIFKSTLYTLTPARNTVISALNRHIRQVCSRLQPDGTRSCDYIDLNRKLSTDTIAPGFTSDGTHLTLSAYEQWKELLAPYMRACDTATP